MCFSYDYNFFGVQKNKMNLSQGGVQANVVPDKFVLTFDIRITPTADVVG